MWIACIILAMILIITSAYLIILKRDMRHMSKQLEEIIYTDTNAQLTIVTTDKEITTLAYVINCALEEHRQVILETTQREENLKSTLTNISHDLRTPLTSVMGYLQMMENAADDEKQRYAAIIRGRLNTLVVLTNRLFEFTQLTENKMPIEQKKLNIASVLRDSLAIFYSELTEKGFAIDIDIPDTPVYVQADENALLRVLQNVLRNVVEHGEQNISVALTPEGELSIGNRVQNIQSIEIGHLFDRFYTADASRTSKNTGLGLAIVKELVSRMDGQIAAFVEEDLLVIRMQFLLIL